MGCVEFADAVDEVGSLELVASVVGRSVEVVDIDLAEEETVDDKIGLVVIFELVYSDLKVANILSGEVD